jgi:thioredoxin 2
MSVIITCANCGAKNRVDEARLTQAQPVCGRCGAKLSAPGAAGKAVEVTDGSIAEFLSSAGDRPALVDCWAPWCGPCRMIGPTIDQLAAESGGRYLVGKLNVDQNPATAQRFNVSSIPALLLFKGGRLAGQVVGVQPKQVIAAKLAELL